MSELEDSSEQKRELTGIAGAVDALFRANAADATPVPVPDEGSSERGAASRDGPQPLTTEPPIPPDRGGAASTEEAAPSSALPPPLPDEPPPLPDGSPFLPDEPPSLPDRPPPPSLSGESSAGSPTTGAALGAAATESSSSGAHPDSTSGGSHDEATPLDDAVASFIQGTGSAHEVTRLADEMLEQNSLDPVARAVATLVLAAGEPPDAGILAIAERLISPVVLGRLARRLAADPNRRPEYVNVARTIGRPMATAIRDDVAESVEPELRDGHVAALIGLGEQARTVVEEMAESDNRFLVRAAVEVLGVLGGARALPLIRDALTNPDARVRTQSLRSLQALGDRESESLIAAMLEDGDGRVRTTAAAVAADFGLKRAVGRITALLEESAVPDETIELLDALGRLGDPGAVASIEKHAVRTLFSKPPAEIRVAAYRALHRIGTPHAKQLLRQAAADKDPRVGAAVNELIAGG